MHYILKFRKIFEQKVFQIIGVVIFLGIILFLMFGSYGKNGDTTILQVTRKDIMEEVVVTGKTKPAESVHLAFLRSGKVAEIYGDIGTTVIRGQKLVALDSTELIANLHEAEASLEVQKANLAEFERGTRREEITVSEVKYENTKRAFQETIQNLSDVMRDAYTKSDDAIRNKVDQFFINPRTQNAQLSFSPSNSQLLIDSNSGRMAVETILINWYITLQNATPENRNTLQNLTKQNLDSIKSFLNNIALAVNGISTGGTLSQSTLTTWRGDVASARTNVDGAISTLNAAVEKYTASASALDLAEKELALLRAGHTAEQIKAQQFQVIQADAKVAGIRAQLSHTVLRAPIDGVITLQDAKRGEIVAANTVLVNIISAHNLEIESHIPEVDIGRIARENPVHITLDAFPGEQFEGVVTSIDPGETILDGVVNYTITVAFIKSDARVRSGLTANLAILTQKKTRALVLPHNAILETDAGAFVRVIDANEKIQETKVTLGIRSQDGFVEILEGVNENMRVQNVGIRASK